MLAEHGRLLDDAAGKGRGDRKRPGPPCPGFKAKRLQPGGGGIQCGACFFMIGARLELLLARHRAAGDQAADAFEIACREGDLRLRLYIGRARLAAFRALDQRKRSVGAYRVAQIAVDFCQPPRHRRHDAGKLVLIDLDGAE